MPGGSVQPARWAALSRRLLVLCLVAAGAWSVLLGIGAATDGEPDVWVRQDVPWHLDRISQRALPLTGAYEYRYTGEGVRIYVFDTGTRVSHEDFGGRFAPGYDALGAGAPEEDPEGHGTEVASAAAGTTHGVAPGATVVPVRVLDATGGNRQPGFEPFMAALDWVLDTHPEDAVGGVLTVSLDGFRYEEQAEEAQRLEAKVEELIAAGLVVVWAADTRGEGDVLFAPEGMRDVIVVGATTREDALLPGSNHGDAVDLYAPGEAMLLASNDSDTATDVKLGTSFAAPIVAGVAALLLEEDPTLTVPEVRDRLLARSTPGAIVDLPSGHNRLVYSLPDEAAARAPMWPWVAAAVAVAVLVALTAAYRKRRG